MTILPGCLHKPEFSTLRSYLSDDQEGVKLFQLSSKIADLFDQYLVFRPGMILGWEQGETPTDFRPALAGRSVAGDRHTRGFHAPRTPA